MKNYIDEQLVQEQHFEMAMGLVEDKNWKALRELVDHTDSITAEAIKESLSAADMNNFESI